MRRARTKDSRGFTLIEVILATTLFALLMSSYYVVFTRVVELEAYARDQRAFGTVGPAILDLIEDDLLSLYSHPREPDAFPFRGDDESSGGKPADRMFFVVRRASVHQEEFFGDERLQALLAEIGGESAANACKTVALRIAEYEQGSPHDDVTLLALRRA